jgi:hypothetical protein
LECLIYTIFQEFRISDVSVVSSSALTQAPYSLFYWQITEGLGSAGMM